MCCNYSQSLVLLAEMKNLNCIENPDMVHTYSVEIPDQECFKGLLHRCIVNFVIAVTEESASHLPSKSTNLHVNGIISYAENFNSTFTGICNWKLQITTFNF